MSSEIQLDSYSMWTRTKGGYDYYDWCVFVDEPPEVLDEIQWVEYTLHPTFPDPVRRISDRETRFALLSSGWGSFRIRILVRRRDGTEVRTHYDLELHEDDWPRGEAHLKELGEETERVYQALPDGTKYRWRKLGTIARTTGMSDEQVLDALRQLEERRLVRKAPFQSIDSEELWGSTSIVGILPMSPLGKED